MSFLRVFIAGNIIFRCSCQIVSISEIILISQKYILEHQRSHTMYITLYSEIIVKETQIFIRKILLMTLLRTSSITTTHTHRTILRVFYSGTTKTHHRLHINLENMTNIHQIQFISFILLLS